MTGVPADRSAAAQGGKRPWGAALGWTLVLGTLFFTTYGFANWAAGARAPIGSIVFDWERAIPFWPWTIVPYWSIDALYGLSLFVCATRAELAVQVKRLLTAQAIAIACFLAWPLTFTFERPATDGVFGWMFDALAGFDKPFNQAPSLHIVLLVILWARFARHLSGAWRVLLDLWLALIGLSILTTYQHHFVDLPTGWLAGWFCVWLFPDDRPSVFARAVLTNDPVRRRLALRYALGAAALAILALSLRGWASWLLWPAVSLALVAFVYLALDAAAFEKRPDGRLSAASWFLFGPYVAAAWLNSRWWTRRDARMAEIVPGLFIGRVPRAADLAREHIRSVVDLTAELPLDSAGRAYANVPMLDLTVPSAADLERAVQAIESARAAGPTLVCCALGYSRSALAAAAWLSRHGGAPSVDAAVATLRRARPRLVLADAHLARLQ